MKRTQIGWVIILVISFLTISTFIINTDPHQQIKLVILSGLILINFGCLTIKVDQEYVRCAFGVGLIRWKYKLSDIEKCSSITTFSLGWGVRFQKDGVLYNVSGNKAIELSLKGKSRLVKIGTDKPNELVSYINEKRALINI
jgi:hypothetical protein